MRRKILFILALSITFFVVFFTAFFLMMPTDAVRHLAEKTIEKQLGYKQAVEIDNLSISPLLNLSLQNFKLTPRQNVSDAAAFATEGGSFNGFYCAPYVEPQPFIIDNAEIFPSLSAALKRTFSGQFDLQIQDGKIDGNIQAKANTIEITAHADNISLNEFALLSNLSGMQIYGGLTFDMRAVLEKSNIQELTLSLNATNTALCPKRLKLDVPGLPFFELPFTVFGNIEAVLEIHKDKLKIVKLTSDGPDIKLNINGDIFLKSSKTPIPRLAIDATITPSNAWIEEHDMKAIYQLCEKLDDGSIKLSLKGTVKKLKHDCGTPVATATENTPPQTETPSNDDKNSPAKNDTSTNSKKKNNITADFPTNHTDNNAPPTRARPAIRGNIPASPRQTDDNHSLRHSRPQSRNAIINRKLDAIDKSIDSDIQNDPRNSERRRATSRNIRHASDESN